MTVNDNFMRKFRRKLTILLGKECTACGHEELVREAVDARIDLERFVEDEIKRLSDRGPG